MENKLNIFFKLGRLNYYYRGFIVSIEIDKNILSKISRVVGMGKDLNDSSISTEFNLRKFDPKVYVFPEMYRLPPDIDEIFPRTKGNVCRDIIIPESIKNDNSIIDEVKIVVRCSKVFFVLGIITDYDRGTSTISDIRIDNTETWKEIISNKLDTL